MAKVGSRRFQPNGGQGAASSGLSRAARGPPTPSNYRASTSGYIDDWDDPQLDDALTQLAIQQAEYSNYDKNVTPDGKSRRGPEMAVREMARTPKRNFSPGFTPQGSKNSGDKFSHRTQQQQKNQKHPQFPFNGSNGSIPGELVLFSQESKSSFQREIEELKKQNCLKEAETRVLRDLKKDAEKQLFDLRIKLRDCEKDFSETCLQLEMKYGAEKEKLKAEKQFMDKEKHDLERSLIIEKAARQKAEFEKQHFLANRENCGSVTVNGGSAIKSEPQPANHSSRHSNAAAFPTVKNFYSPSTPSDSDAPGGKRRKLAGDEQNLANGDAVTAAVPSLAAPKRSSTVVAAVAVITADYSVQTETSTFPTVNRRAELTKFSSEECDKSWYIAELMTSQH